jgi:hypothetical protein
MGLLKKALRKTVGKMPILQESGPLILNEAVNFEKQVIFIAVPKTGTTSVRSQLRQEGIPLIRNPHLDIVQVRDSLYVYFLRRALGGNKSFPSDSVLTNAEIRTQAKDVFLTFFKFSAVRNPWARAVSLYSRREGVITKDKLSFGEFCKNHFYASDTCGQPTLHHNQLDWLCDEEGQCIMDYVYKLEDFDQAIKEIAERTNGRLQLATKTANRNPSSLSRSYRELYTEETRNMIAKRFERDIDYFKYTF